MAVSVNQNNLFCSGYSLFKNILKVFLWLKPITQHLVGEGGQGKRIATTLQANLAIE